MTLVRNRFSWPAQLKEAYDKGYDSIATGPNIINCHFALFRHRTLTEAWENGVRQAKKDACFPKPSVRQIRMQKKYKYARERR